MFRRTCWFSTGVAAGVWATTKVNRKLKQLTPENLAGTVVSLFETRDRLVAMSQKARSLARPDAARAGRTLAPAPTAREREK